MGRRGRGSPGPTSDHVPGLPRELRHLLQRQQRLPGTPRDLLERRSPAGRAGRCPSPPVPPGAAPSAPGTGVHRHARGAAGASSGGEALAVPGRGAARSRRSVPPPFALLPSPERVPRRVRRGADRSSPPFGPGLYVRHGLPRAGTCGEGAPHGQYPPARPQVQRARRVSVPSSPPVARALAAAPGRDPLGNQSAPPGNFSARSVTRIQGRTELFLLPAFVLVRSFSLSTFIAPARVVPAARPQHFGRLRWDFGRCRPSYSRSCCSRRGTRRDGWLEVGSGSFQCLRLSARFSPAKLCLRGADTLCQAGTARGPRWDPLAGGVRLCSALCPPVLGSSPAGRGSFRAGASWGSPERSPAPLPTQAPLPGGASRMGKISYGSGVNSRT